MYSWLVHAVCNLLNNASARMLVGVVVMLLLMISGDIESNPGPITTQLKPGDLGVLNVLVQDVAAYWVNIADQLGLQSQVDTIRRSPDNVTPQDFLRNLLNIWLHQDHLPTLEELCRALKSDNAIIGGAGVAKRLEEEFRHRQGQPLPVVSVISHYADYLKAIYKAQPVAPDIPGCCKWPPTPSTQYINLAVVKKAHATRKEADKYTKETLRDPVLKVKESISLEDVLKPEGETEVKVVLVEGAPGIGKSTFAWELCRRWDEIEAMKKYSVVVLLRLRDKQVQEAKTVGDLFYHDNSNFQRDVVEVITSTGGEMSYWFLMVWMKFLLLFGIALS